MEQKGPRKKKILFIITKSNFGGAQRYVYELATKLPKDAYEVAVAFGGSGLLKEKLEEAEIPTFEIKSFERDVSILKDLRALQELFSLIETWEPDVLHLNSSKAGGLGSFAGRLLGIPRIIFTAHGWPFYENRHVVWQVLMWFFSYLTTLFAHIVIVVSTHDFDRHMMPFMAKKLVRIPTAVPHLLFKERQDARVALFSEAQRKAHENDLWVVSTGELTPNKNLLSLLDATREANQSREQKIFLSLMGEGEERGVLESFVQKHGMQDQVAFLGFIDNARVYLKAFDVFVLPSLKEGMPYGLLEAGAAGLYVIASNVGGIPDIITHKETGILIDPALGSTLPRALTDASHEDKQMGEALRVRVQTEFSIDALFKKTENLY